MPASVVYVDTEHDRVVDDLELGVSHYAKIAAARRRIATVADVPCLVARFADVLPATVEQAGAAAIVISGCTTDWDHYDFAEMAGLMEVIRAATVPILGICAGHQLVGFAHGAPWGPLEPLAEGETDPDPRFAPGQRKERGFLPVHVDPGCRLFRGIAPNPSFYQSHYWQLTATPPGFVSRASSPWSAIQAIERRDRPVFGVQFHPERSAPEHRAGETVLENFFALVRGRV